MSDLRIYSGDELYEGLSENVPLIKGVLWQEDFVMLLGSEKAGKSILAMQMAFALTSGCPFLERYEVPEAVPVLYLQAEGRRSEYMERFDAMRESLQVNKNLFYHIPKKYWPLDIPELFNEFVACVDKCNPKPRVMILDPLYMIMAGDLNDNKASRNFLHKIAYLIERYKTSILLVHHESKPLKDKDTHQAVDRGDTGSYGSVFFRSNVDHILYFKMQKDKTRILTCSTQRSGNVLEEEQLILVQPSPLYFQVKGGFTAAEVKVKECIFNRFPISYAEIEDITKVAHVTAEKAVYHLLDKKMIQRIDKKPATFAPIHYVNR